MKRFWIGLSVLIVVAAAIFVFVSREKSAASASGVASLLPADTVALIHIPDVEKSRDAWQRTDLYQLYHEPALQDFLRKPRTQLPKGGAVAEAWHDAVSLRIRDAFLATNTVDNLRLIGGFEFRCGEKEAWGVIERWKDRLKEQGAQWSTSAYGNRAIDVFTNPRWTMASVLVGHRYFAGTNIEDIKSLLDRVDGRTKEAGLAADDKFRAAMKQMPADYAGLLYLQPKSFAKKLAALRAQSGRALPAGQETLIERVQSFSHTMVFENGKLRDVDFVAMPQLVNAKLTRELLSTASTDTLFYLALILNLRQQLDAGTAQNSLFSSAGVTLADWEAAFGDEMSLLADWPMSARIPAPVMILNVRDAARAKKVAHALASASSWQSSARGDIEYFAAPAAGLRPMRLTGALSGKRAGIGLDAASVERAVSPPAEGDRLESAATFRGVSRLVPEPKQMFAWLDLPALYGRLDATLRPLLQISAALMPDPSGRFDMSKLPPAEIVTKHLSPVVASQSYVDGGYRSESVGTITLGQAAVLGMGGYVGWQAFQKGGDVPSGWKFRSVPAARPSATP
jgi:hypothetical protein